MKQNRRTGLVILLLTAFLLLLAGTAQAQSDERGSISGAVYKDVNGDGVCVNTGVAGEEPVEGVTIEFVSSDEATVVTLTTADNGTYGLAAAGQSYWRVTAKPDTAKYVVTSENPRYAPVFPNDGLVQTGYDFCVSEGTNAVIILPESGAAASTSGGSWIVWVTAVFGLALVGMGIFLEWKRRTT
ncbi:SdrD B-like domain-containing protein [Candidatus Leptofilum sp.]|uniref:SdrD B-like domain-containing protein n=1 Tax=Candidatus Leptofilum sp. TaxID=3241576 RepID=UPI003B5C1A5C